jgi:16S rRNA G966 N2-methylase RsmD
MSMTLFPAPTLAGRAGSVEVSGENGEFLEIPPGRDTTYLTHGLFRYAGKLPPPLVAWLLQSYTEVGDTVLDPMSGGGTTAIEAVTSGRLAISFDINPVSLLVADALTRPTDIARLHEFGARALADRSPLEAEGELGEFFSPEAYGLLRRGLDLARQPVEKTLILSIARKASFANTKKINTVVDRTKTPRPARELFAAAHHRFVSAFEDMNAEVRADSTVRRARAQKLPLEEASIDFVLLHPPYLTNTAFSESMHLQLLLLGHNPESLRKNELAFRGSYFYVTNGLRKYLVGWSNMLAEAFRVSRAGAHVTVVVGDGRIDRVRIPIATITEEFAADIGFERIYRGEHILNNQTGWTLSRRMSRQHVLVFRKP